MEDDSLDEGLAPSRDDFVVNGAGSDEEDDERTHLFHPERPYKGTNPAIKWVRASLKDMAITSNPGQ